MAENELPESHPIHLVGHCTSTREGDAEAKVFLRELPQGGLAITLHLTGRRGGRREEAVVLNAHDAAEVFAAIAARHASKGVQA